MCRWSHDETVCKLFNKSRIISSHVVAGVTNSRRTPHFPAVSFLSREGIKLSTNFDTAEGVRRTKGSGVTTCEGLGRFTEEGRLSWGLEKKGSDYFPGVINDILNTIYDNYL